ncbi:hypothetical protein GCM10028815_21430 [Mariniluteicoccus flavus]
MIAKHYSVVTAETGAQVRAYTTERPWEAAPALVRATILRQVFGNRHLLESMTEFWSDQVYVAAQGKSESYVAHYNHTVLRRHALGRYADLLLAAVRHPALLVYLDNDANSKDNPNENLGRELLELHTVGVGNYTEADVRQSTLLLTGHGYEWQSLAYRYRPWDHHVGALRVMDFSDANADAAQGEALLARYVTHLARHRATAKRLATRLARRFVADVPPAALVDRLAATYLANDTRIAPVLRELFASPEFAASVGQKWRRPQEAMNGMLRAVKPADLVPLKDPRAEPWGTMNHQLWLLGLGYHQPRSWPFVDGFPDTADAWVTTNILRGTWNAAEAIAGAWNDEIKIPPLSQTFPLRVGEKVADAVRRLTLELTGWQWAERDLLPVGPMLYSWGRDAAPPRATVTTEMNQTLPHAIRLILSSPYFQMR